MVLSHFCFLPVKVKIICSFYEIGYRTGGPEDLLAEDQFTGEDIRARNA